MPWKLIETKRINKKSCKILHSSTSTISYPDSPPPPPPPPVPRETKNNSLFIPLLLSPILLFSLKFKTRPCIIHDCRRRWRSSRRSCGATSRCTCTARSSACRSSRRPRKVVWSSSPFTYAASSARPASSSFTKVTHSPTSTTSATAPWRSCRTRWSSPFSVRT